MWSMAVKDKTCADYGPVHMVSASMCGTIATASVIPRKTVWSVPWLPNEVD